MIISKRFIICSIAGTSLILKTRADRATNADDNINGAGFMPVGGVSGGI